MLCLSILLADMFGENEWRYFVGDIVPDLGMTMARDFPSWASPDRTALYNLLTQARPHRERVASRGLPCSPLLPACTIASSPL